MDIALTLLHQVRWRGRAIVGERPRALLAALAGTPGRPTPDERLIELVWGGDTPADAAKSLQVLVSRTRAACGPESIVRDGAGYRLGLGPDDVDSVRLACLVRDAGAALDRDPAAAAESARAALALAADPDPAAADDVTPLAAIRRAAAADLAAARAIRAQALSRTGAHAEALPALEAAAADRPDDEALLSDLLHSEAAVRSPAAALERYDRHRRDLRERLGADPGERLQRVHRELLARDRPVRTGVRFDATPLVGRDDDIARLRALMDGSRVVSIVGAGGLGKTRLAHVLARDAPQPVVHVVELVGVTAAEDVVGEVGSVLGVRDSVSSRRTLTPRQRADVRARIAQRLGQAPSLLVLDNCEHLIAAVADLVAFLVATSAEVQVLTTSRAPLAIAAERIHLLNELAVADARQLFCDRAIAARPALVLDDEAITRIVVRLDGLPLAIELAAAKVRAMTIEEIDRRLENRFALLRGGDRSAPDRHQTLLAVIDWSWNLLDEPERRALRRLALFNDGFTLRAAEAVLGDGALEAVQGLVDQSLVSVQDTASGARYRMLETVREFGRMHLIDAGDDAAARAARRRWATTCARSHGDQLISPGQLAAIDALDDEQTNLADELRDAIADGDVAALVQLLAALGLFWAIRGEHGRIIAIAGAVADAVEGWTAPPELADSARAGIAITLTNSMITRDERMVSLRAGLARLGPGGPAQLNGMIRVLLECDPTDAAFGAQLERLLDDPDRYVVWSANQWLSTVRENAGDIHGAIAAAERALQLSGPDEGPWPAAILRTQLSQLRMHVGDLDRAIEYARDALPVMRRLGARDDVLQLHSLLAMCAVADGDLSAAERELLAIERVDEGAFGGFAIQEVSRAELALARGDVDAGLQAHRDAAAHMRELRFPGIAVTGTEPWVLFGAAAALTAHAYHATGADEESGWALFHDCRDRVLRTLDPADIHLDFPVNGLALFALGAWSLLRRAAPAEQAVTLLVLAERFAYNRTIPTMQWDRIASHIDERLPGELAGIRNRYQPCSSGELLGEARRLVEQLPEGRPLQMPLVAADGQRSEQCDHDEAGQ